jgi:uncharacterized protein RhaS with RHS repeats
MPCDHVLSGRWISRDPIAESGGLNLYGYVGNDPIDRNDLVGLFWGFNFFPLNDPLYSSANNIPNNFTYQVAGHGIPHALMPLNDVWSPQDLVNIVTGDPAYIPGTPITIYSCDAGTGDPAFAQEVANLFGVPVTGPNAPLEIYGNGAYNALDGGSIVTFNPVQVPYKF